MEVIKKTQSKNLWPAPISELGEWKGKKVLIIRRDHLGDMCLSLSFLSRLKAAGAQFKVLATDRWSRELLSTVSVQTYEYLEDAVNWKPEWVIFLEFSRHLRATRHPERWAFVEKVLNDFPYTPILMPSMRKAEAMSYFPGSYAKPFQAVTAEGLLENFGNHLGLPDFNQLESLVRPYFDRSTSRSNGKVVINLSAGQIGVRDHRWVPISVWENVLSQLPEDIEVAFISTPQDSQRRREMQNAVESKGFQNVEFFSQDLEGAFNWLTQQRMLVSPETGLCHFAAQINLPRVVLTGENLVPYWYPPKKELRCVFAKDLKDIPIDGVVSQVNSLLSRNT